MPTLYCPKCGYNLHGLTENRCPECGDRFSRAELAAIGGIKHPSIGMPLTCLLLLPVFFGVLAYESFGSGVVGDLFDEFFFFILAIYVLLSLGSSTYIARNIARRIMMRPPKSRPVVGSVVLTITFAGIFFAAQGAVVFVAYFVGCAVNFKM